LQIVRIVGRKKEKAEFLFELEERRNAAVGEEEEERDIRMQVEGFFLVL